jgi:DNA gyrase subunit A
MFATTKGSVRRNKLSDFVGIRQNGKIAMKLDDDMDILGVDTCTENDDVMLTTALGQSIRFSVGDVRVFQSRDSTGVRGVRLAAGDEVISMSIVHHFEATPDERTAYIKQSRRLRGEAEDETEVVEIEHDDEADVPNDLALPVERFEAMAAAEQFIMTVSERGYGKRSSAFEYRRSGRGGKGISAMSVSKRNGPLVASFPVEDNDQIMLVTDGGQLIRCPVNGIRVAGRATQGVTIFNTADGEKVVSVEHINEPEDDGEEDLPDSEGAEDTAVDQNSAPADQS